MEEILLGIFVFALAQVMGVCLLSIPFAIYGMVKRKQADKHKEGAFTYMKYYSIEEARKYAPYVAVSLAMKLGILERCISVVSALVLFSDYDGAFESILAIIVAAIILRIVNKFKKKKELPLKERFGDEFKSMKKKMYMMGIGEWLWMIPLALTGIGLIAIVIMFPVIQSAAESDEERKRRYMDEAMDDYWYDK